MTIYGLYNDPMNESDITRILDIEVVLETLNLKLQNGSEISITENNLVHMGLVIAGKITCFFKFD